ncbi:MAG: 4-hydroxy-tetrahydrodipicolinate reductase [Bacteroidales bacterium]|jgi:4-hydroxy-tetrahydrodipicolinate reductase|nr:4-hydroxy-tetrahydrodipicolinate reductase [Bacteroidales bacterium]
MNIILIGYGKMGHEVEKVALAHNHKIVHKIDNDSDWKTLPTGDYVAIDFSMPAVVVSNIERCFDKHISVVVGTTGWDADKARLQQRCLNENQALFHASNFSIGVYLFIRAAKFLAAQMPKQYSPSIAETHHIHKLDKPSGTALTLAKEVFGAADTVPIESIREGEVSGIHELKFMSPEDEIILKHTAYSRAGFAFGAVRAAEWLVGKNGWFGMDEMIGM